MKLQFDNDGEGWLAFAIVVVLVLGVVVVTAINAFAR